MGGGGGGGIWQRAACDVAILFRPQNFIRQARRTTNHNYYFPALCVRGGGAYVHTSPGSSTSTEFHFCKLFFHFVPSSTRPSFLLFPPGNVINHLSLSLFLFSFSNTRPLFFLFLDITIKSRIKWRGKRCFGI